MSRSTARYYWWCQLFGWIFLALMSVLLYSISDQKVSEKFLQRLGVMVFAGILSTHLFREFLRRSNWLIL